MTCERRKTIASAVAVGLILFHLAISVNVLFLVDGQCLAQDSSSPQAERAKTACLHSVFIWLWAAFLNFRERLECDRAQAALCVLEHGLILFTTWQTGLCHASEDARAYRVVTWRMILGVCVGPQVALVGSVAYSLGTSALYLRAIPDGMVVLTRDTGAMRTLLCEGCCKLFDAEQLMRSIELMPEQVHWPVKDFFISIAQKRTDFRAFMVEEAAILFCLAVLLMVVQWLVSNDVNQSLKLQESEEQRAAFQRMLDTLCDATLELSSDCHIAKPAHRLDVLLHYAPTAGEMSGTDFRALISRDRDRKAFESFMHDCSGGCDGAKSMRLSLRGDQRTDVHAQLLLSAFRDMFGCHCFLCGVNKVSDSEKRPGPINVEDTVTANETGDNYYVEISAETTQISNITEPLEGFLELTGDILEAPRLSELLTKPHLFQGWLQDCMDSICDGSVTTPFDAPLQLDVHKYFRRPLRQLQQTTYSLDCRVYFPAPPDGGPINPESYVITLQVLRIRRNGGQTGNDAVPGALLSRPQTGCSADGSKEGPSNSIMESKSMDVDPPPPPPPLLPQAVEVNAAVACPEATCNSRVAEGSSTWMRVESTVENL